MNGYLFVHFTGEHLADGEQVYFSVSEDGLNWQDLNGGKPVLTSPLGDCGVRDPFIVRHPETGVYYLMATDLCIYTRKDWGEAQRVGSRDLIVWESTDLCHWSEPRAITVGVEGAGCVWAPEAIFDEERGMFFVFFASMVKAEGDKEPKQRMYGAYTADFRTFTQTALYEEDENHLIDMNIVRDGDWYYRFVKDETTKCIRMERVRSIQGEVEIMHSELLSGLYGVEGPECYRLHDGRWCLIVDQFATHKGYLPLLCEDLSTGVFTVAEPGSYQLGETPKRHGGVLDVTMEELAALKAHYGA